MKPTTPLPTIKEILSILRRKLSIDPIPKNDNGRARNDTRVRVLVPRRYNDGRLVPILETAALLRDLLQRVSGGVTLTVAWGVCVDGPEVEIDEMLAFEITSPNMDTLVDVLEAWAPRLGQRAIYVEKMTCTALHIGEEAPDTERVPTKRSAA